MPPPTSERMSRVDHAWLRMDSDANLMMIIGFWLLAPKLTFADLRQRVQSALLAYPRFVQKVVEDDAGAMWVEDKAFDIGHHVSRETLRTQPGEPALDALKRRVAELATQPLDPSRPLWQFHLVEDLDGTQSALICRIHHCIGDGMALISVTLSIADGGRPPPQCKPREPCEPREPRESKHDWTEPFVTAASKGMQALGSPDAARVGLQAMQDAAALVLMADDSPTRLKGTATPGKRVAWGEPLPLDEVKAVSKAYGVSINDVLLSAVAGAIGSYLQSKGDDTAGQEIRAMVPINLRPIEEAYKLGNHFGLVPLVLPIGIAHPGERLYAVNARMNALKGSCQPLLAFGVLALSGLMVKPMQDLITGVFAKKATAVMTNVPGPREPLLFCGRTVKQVMFWVPQSGDIGVGVSILSYAGGVQFGLITDARMCPDPEAIVERFGPEFEKLLWLALMSPWPVMA
jgi:diacylglycerol O-acyltransferase / wax synthase